MVFLNVATATFVYANSSLDSLTICGSTAFKVTPPAARDARGGLSSDKERRKVLPRESRKVSSLRPIPGQALLEQRLDR
jgi:hypothetical protein